mmetsp:Transcript_26770/g.51985  ORF Transcript_26770/g.51985 Transcript_26770/m.51985 type:complete len:143 (+) Transcript_26770:173-601(+)
MADDNGRSFHGPPGLGLGAYKSMRAPARAFSAPPSVDDIDSLFSELNHAMDKSSRLLSDTVPEEAHSYIEMPRAASTAEWAPRSRGAGAAGHEGSAGAIAQVNVQPFGLCASKDEHWCCRAAVLQGCSAALLVYLALSMSYK